MPLGENPVRRFVPASHGSSNTPGLWKEITVEHANWSCPKCGNRSFETDQFQATGGWFAKLFDVQNKRFHTVSCMQCGYTEIYRATTSSLANVFDFFTN